MVLFFTSGFHFDFTGDDVFLDLIDFVEFFPWQIQIAATEMTIGGSLAVNRPAQAKVFDDCTRAQVEYFANHFFDLFGSNFAGAESIHVNRHRAGNADGISDLNFKSIGQACGANPVPIIVPCHRILGAGGLGGFSAPGGVETKVALLRFEGAAGLLI